MTKSYGQFCGLARALDVVGDRWSLLIVRQLLVAPARYGELLAHTRVLDLRGRGLAVLGLSGDVAQIDAADFEGGGRLRGGGC